jgi:hypothetical protein
MSADVSMGGIMRIFGIKKILTAAVLGLGLVAFGSVDANAQSRRDRELQRIQREQQRIQREYQRAARQRARDRRNDVYMGGRGVSSNAFRMGYDFGFQAGANDGRRGKYNQSNVYRSTPAWSGGDPSSADYLYRQGYLQGYEDGFRNGRGRY